VAVITDQPKHGQPIAVRIVFFFGIAALAAAGAYFTIGWVPGLPPLTAGPNETGRHPRRLYSSISRSFSSSSATTPLIRRIVSWSGACRASARYFMIFISSSTRSFFEGTFFEGDFFEGDFFEGMASFQRLWN
jgi:hypothetical protein